MSKEKEGKMKRFVFIVFFVLILLWTYVGFSLILPVLRGTGYDWLGGFFLGVTFLLQVWRWTQMRKAETHLRLLFAAYFSLGLICHLLVAAIVKDVTQIFTPLSQTTLGIIILACLALNFVSLYIAFRGPTVRKVQIKTQYVGKPVKIVQFSDLHVGPMIEKDYVENVVQKILDQKPDLIFATGDIGDGNAEAMSPNTEPLRRLAQNAPSFYVPGNHEYYWNGPEWIQHMESLGFSALINQGLPVDLAEKIPLWIGGVPDQQAESFVPAHKTEPHKAISAKGSKDRFKILLAHRPQSCYEAEKAGFDLMVCGHTHGGQFFPFTLIVGFFNAFSRGMNHYKRLMVYVNVGTGFWGPPLRLGARAEITCFEICEDYAMHRL